MLFRLELRSTPPASYFVYTVLLFHFYSEFSSITFGAFVVRYGIAVLLFSKCVLSVIMM